MEVYLYRLEVYFIPKWELLWAVEKAWRHLKGLDLLQ